MNFDIKERSLVLTTDDVISRNAAITSITASTTKPSFLLWEKVYQKLTEPEEEKWLLRAGNAALTFFKSDFSKNETLRCVAFQLKPAVAFLTSPFRSQLGLVFVHLVLEGSSPEIRREVHNLVKCNASRRPQLINRVIRDALTTFVSRGTPVLKAISADEPPKPWNKHSRLSTLILSAVSFDDTLALTVREEIIVELIVLGHHHLICASVYPSPWIISLTIL